MSLGIVYWFCNFLSFFSFSSSWIRCLENCALQLLNIVSFSLFIRFYWSHCLGSLLSFLIVIATKFCSFFLFFFSPSTCHIFFSLSLSFTFSYSCSVRVFDASISPIVILCVEKNSHQLYLFWRNIT